MAGSMQILVLEKAVYELEEMVKKTLKQIDEKIELQDKKFEKYEKFLKGFEGGVRIPGKIEEKPHVAGDVERKYGEDIQRKIRENKKQERENKKLKRRKKQKEEEVKA